MDNFEDEELEYVREMGWFDKPKQKMDYSRYIDCAAIKAPDGRVWTGKRHNHCIATIIQATGVKRVGEGYEQGFVTMAGNFVNRMEAGLLALESQQVKELRFSSCDLYSEDLY